MNCVLVEETISLCPRIFASEVGPAIWVDKVKTVITVPPKKFSWFYKTLFG